MTTQFPILNTKQLTLNQLRLEDVPLITKYAQNTNVAKFLVNMPEPYFEKDAIWWVRNSHVKFEEKNQYTFAIREKSSPDFIGGIGLIIYKKDCKANIGYWLAEQHWNKGYMSEALQVLINFAFQELKLKKVYASHYADNIASGIIMQKAGMTKEGYMKEELFKNGKYYDSVKYGLIAKDYFNMQ